jgi:hypothetical protein
MPIVDGAALAVAALNAIKKAITNPVRDMPALTATAVPRRLDVS